VNTHRSAWPAIAPALVCALTVFSGTLAYAAFPPPANDTSATAIAVGPLPAIIEGANVNGTNTINATTLGGLASVPGPDVFYRFTPSATGDYWAMMIPWIQVPQYGSSGGGLPNPNLCIYIRRVSDGVFIAGSDANPGKQADTVVAMLSAGVEYDIVIDSTSNLPLVREFEFTLVVSEAPSGSPEDCAGPGTVPFGPFPHAAVGSLTGAVDDFTFVEGTGRCDVSNTIGLASLGPDHVYEFTTGPNPSDAGEYLVNLVPAGTAWNGYIYVADSCPPFFPLGCLGAASHTSFTTQQSETLVVSLDFDKTYYIFVDAATTLLTDAKYALIVSKAEDYRIREIEPNDTPATATPLDPSEQNGGQILGGADVDYHALAADAGDRLYAFLDNGNNLLSSIDVELRVFHTDGVSLLELDDDDGEGSSSAVNILVQRSSAFSAAIAGLSLSSAGTYYLHAQSESAVSTVARYLLHYGIEPGGRGASGECEPNDGLDAADVSGKEYFEGIIETDGDVDTYEFDAVAGDRVYVSLDGDPERDSGGDADNDPLSLDGALAVFDPAGDAFLSDHDDPNLVGGGQIPDFPAEALAFVAPASGTWRVRVSGGGAGDFGPGKSYRLAIFKNNQAPALIEGVDPVIDSVTPDFGDDMIDIVASDDAPGDSGICAVGLSGDSDNIQVFAAFTPGDGVVSITVSLVNPGMSGSGKVVVTDCAGNTACAFVQIDADPPVCGGAAATSPRRVFRSTHGPIHAPDNQPLGPGIDGTIDIAEAGTIDDLNVTLTIETIRPLDVDVFLESPLGTRLEIVTDRGGSSAFDITEATFDDGASELMSLLSSEAPYTGTWLPEGAGGLAVFNGQDVGGTWKLNVIDDASSGSGAGGGARLVRWSLDADAGLPNPEFFQGSVSDTAGVSGGIASIVLSAGVNVVLEVSPDFVPGDLTTEYTLSLINPSQNGSGTITVTDTSDNSCQSLIALDGLLDASSPSNSGAATRDIEIGAEVLTTVASADPAGVVSSVVVPDTAPVGEVEVDITVDTLNVGRIASTLTHGGSVASLINRVGMDERGSVGLTKDNIEITLDDDAPAADDAHVEPPLGSIEFLGVHQPDGRGAIIGDGITSDDRDNMMFALEGLDAAGAWDLYVADFRLQGAGDQNAAFRRWAAKIVSPGAAERYVGAARDVFPQAGICSVVLSGGAMNLALDADFTAGDEEADYVVTLLDPTLGGMGTVEITDCAGNTAFVPVSLAAQLDDLNLPVIAGAINPGTMQYEATATDDQPGDSGIASVELAPYADNLQIASVMPDPPNGAASVDIVVELINPAANGRGYVRVTDVTGYRRHALVHIDATAPTCGGAVGNTRRYVSADLPQPLPDNNPSGVLSTISVPNLDVVSDVNVTVNITHPFDDDIDLVMTNPVFLPLFADIGLTGNDFINTTLDDEAAAPIPDSSAAAPFTGSFQPLGGPILFNLDGVPAANSYTLQAADDAVFNEGAFESWSLTIESATFPERLAGEAGDPEGLGLGIASIELLDDACNLTLNVDPFVPGDKLVIFEAALTDPAGCGRGTVRVTDLGANVCDLPVTLNGEFCDAGDVNHDGLVDFDDVDPFVQAILFGPSNCEADINLDGALNGADVQGFTDLVAP